MSSPSATGLFDRRLCWSLYDERLKPVLANSTPRIELDARNEFYLWLLGKQSLLQPGKHLVDLGAGLSVFGPVCRAHGMEVTLVDDFGGGGGVELGNTNQANPVLDSFEKQLG